MADAQLKASMNHTFSERVPSSRTLAGTPSLGAAVTFQAYWERVHKVIMSAGPDGVERQIVLEHLVICERDINQHGAIYFPGENTSNDALGRQPYLLKKFYDSEAATPVLDHVEFYL